MAAPSSTNPPPDNASGTPTLRERLGRCRNIVVIGLSPHAHRDSHRVAAYMQSAGYRIVPVHPGVAAGGGTILGERAHASLNDAARELARQGERIDLVNVFRRSEEVPPVVDEAIAVGAGGIWLQLGIRHDEALARADRAGLWTVQDRCLMVDHRHLLPQMTARAPLTVGESDA